MKSNTSRGDPCGIVITELLFNLLCMHLGMSLQVVSPSASMVQ